jgi:hypothetical protein
LKQRVGRQQSTLMCEDDWQLRHLPATAAR